MDCNFIKKRLKHQFFPVNIAKLLRTPILRTSANSVKQLWWSFFTTIFAKRSFILDAGNGSEYAPLSVFWQCTRQMRKMTNLIQNLIDKMYRDWGWSLWPSENDLQSKTPYLLGIQENADQKKFRTRSLLTRYIFSMLPVFSGTFSQFQVNSQLTTFEF